MCEDGERGITKEVALNLVNTSPPMIVLTVDVHPTVKPSMSRETSSTALPPMVREVPKVVGEDVVGVGVRHVDARDDDDHDRPTDESVAGAMSASHPTSSAVRESDDDDDDDDDDNDDIDDDDAIPSVLFGNARDTLNLRAMRARAQRGGSMGDVIAAMGASEGVAEGEEEEQVEEEVADEEDVPVPLANARDTLNLRAMRARAKQGGSMGDVIAAMGTRGVAEEERGDVGGNTAGDGGEEDGSEGESGNTDANPSTADDGSLKQSNTHKVHFADDSQDSVAPHRVHFADDSKESVAHHTDSSPDGTESGKPKRSVHFDFESAHNHGESALDESESAPATTDALTLDLASSNAGQVHTPAIRSVRFASETLSLPRTTDAHTPHDDEAVVAPVVAHDTQHSGPPHGAPDGDRVMTDRGGLQEDGPSGSVDKVGVSLLTQFDCASSGSSSVS